MSNLTIAIIQHHPAEGAGRIADWASIEGHTLVHFMAPNNCLPRLDEIDGLIILGGPMDVVDSPCWMQAELALINQAVQRNMPILGICLGAQLLASTLGASLSPLKKPELGWQRVLFDNNQLLQVPQWHYQGFNFTDAAVTITASSSLWPQQMFHHQRQVGVQFHPEWDTAQIVQLQLAFGDDCPFNNNDGQMLSAQLQLDTWLNNLLNRMFT
ncbi:gamma-glutamyl-gamma-aminobutyrate hydrolase family protein [Shewanella sp. 1_MG-2023]|uniref:type 1 glutamine amidotransferase n=1 Tax=unclassified Shewanella TaxID=196818 RepID=UPI0026E1A12F|nr:MULTISPECIES: gamma-glutamyl-gamma-aminobutyrate hydrolase family protein [unclassified Shewanella]MDO6612004.1 gamma-glutamyl-gamma-aminobutyrate hydrolase family protein [Shewanella sp. 7_MG-2023]MDO6771920.1 gamma-glutamyl-gamma-aminobutyrate hydrolase family protein [Shewanella sp. 2_MG-2023]MDO6794264.1 gamma-glutamyl-gamma-aminobutyrate hydrolase family protein [Shewanella sp. 1_MG-2023]